MLILHYLKGRPACPIKNLNVRRRESRTTKTEETIMKRKPKMHRENDFDMDNAYQDDDRQVELRDDSNNSSDD